MGEVGDGLMGSPTKFEYLPATESEDGTSASVDLSNLSSSETPETVCASVNSVARHYRRKNMEVHVKVPLPGYSHFIHPLCQMGYNRIEYSEPTYIVLREDKSLQITPSVTHHFPCKKISPTPDVTLAAQTASESARTRTSDGMWVAAGSGDTRVEQAGCEFQHSSRAFSSDVGDGYNEAAGLQGGFYVGNSGIPVRTKKRPRSATKPRRPSTRTRGPDYDDEAKGLLLQFRLEYHQHPDNRGKFHKWCTPVTQRMKERGYDREPKSIRGLYETLKKAYDAVTDDPATTLKKADDSGDFPRTFKPEWVAAIESIRKMDPRSAAQKESRRDDDDGGQEGVVSQSLATTTITGSKAAFAGVGSSSDAADVQAAVLQPVNRQTAAAAPLFCNDLQFLSSSHSQRQKDYEDFSSPADQMATLRALVRRGVESSDSATKNSLEWESFNHMDVEVDCLNLFS